MYTFDSMPDLLTALRALTTEALLDLDAIATSDYLAQESMEAPLPVNVSVVLWFSHQQDQSYRIGAVVHVNGWSVGEVSVPLQSNLSSTARALAEYAQNYAEANRPTPEEVTRWEARAERERMREALAQI